MRGLKLMYLTAVMRGERRTRMGAWIETGGIHRKSEGRSRRTRMGAWIETTLD